MGPCTPSACMGPTCSRGPFRHDEYAQKYFKIARFRPDPAILQDPISARGKFSCFSREVFHAKNEH